MDLEVGRERGVGRTAGPARNAEPKWGDGDLGLQELLPSLEGIRFRTVRPYALRREDPLGERGPRRVVEPEPAVQILSHCFRGVHTWGHEVGSGRPQAPVGFFEDHVNPVKNILDRVGMWGKRIPAPRIRGGGNRS